MEILRQYNSDEEIDGIFVCVGGGGLLAGIAEYVKIIAPHVKVYGVEAEDAAAMTASLDKGERVTLDEVGLFADGAAVREVGEETFRVVQKRVDGMVLVNNDEICSAIKDTFEDTRSILEPAGALSLAGCKKFITQNQITQGNYVCITSGANMNFNRLRFVANRSEIGDGNEALISVTIPEKPGTFHQLHSILHPRNVTELTYRFDDAEQANVIFGYTPARPNDTSDVMEALAKLDFDPRDLTDDEFAKTHVRFLAGGRSKTAVNERIIRFEFPDRPGALKRFLDCLREKGRLDRHGNPVQKVTLSSDTPWNCSLFHYRNYGSDTGKVLAGIQVPPEDSDEFELFLENLGYRYTEETNHWLYSRYLN